MPSIDYISAVMNNLSRKFKTRNPYEICDALGVNILYDDLGTGIKAYYFCHSRIRNIVLNNRISKAFQRILVAHELGHDQLHREIAMLKGFQEFKLFDMATPTEYEANIFAAELLIDDDELLDLLEYGDRCFFSIARELYVPPELLDFKYRILKHKGHGIESLYIAQGDFLKNNMNGCFGEDGDY